MSLITPGILSGALVGVTLLSDPVLSARFNTIAIEFEPSSMGETFFSGTIEYRKNGESTWEFGAICYRDLDYKKFVTKLHRLEADTSWDIRYLVDGVVAQTDLAAIKTWKEIGTRRELGILWNIDDRRKFLTVNADVSTPWAVGNAISTSSMTGTLTYVGLDGSGDGLITYNVVTGTDIQVGETITNTTLTLTATIDTTGTLTEGINTDQLEGAVGSGTDATPEDFDWILHEPAAGHPEGNNGRGLLDGIGVGGLYGIQIKRTKRVMWTGFDLRNCPKHGVFFDKTAADTLDTEWNVFDDFEISHWGGMDDDGFAYAFSDGAIFTDDGDGVNFKYTIIQRFDIFAPRGDGSQWTEFRTAIAGATLGDGTEAQIVCHAAGCVGIAGEETYGEWVIRFGSVRGIGLDDETDSTDSFRLDPGSASYISLANNEILWTNVDLVNGDAVYLGVDRNAALWTSTPQVALQTAYYINKDSGTGVTLHLTAADAINDVSEIDFTVLGTTGDAGYINGQVNGGHYFRDGIAGAFDDGRGAYGLNSDFHNLEVFGCWDDCIECEGIARCLSVWDCKFSKVFTLAGAPSSEGPCYWFSCVQDDFRRSVFDGYDTSGTGIKKQTGGVSSQMTPRKDTFTGDPLGSEATATVTGATNADPCVVTAVAHGYADGQQIVLNSLGGITELNGGAFIVDNPAADTFELVNQDSTGYGTYTSGGTADSVWKDLSTGSASVSYDAGNQRVNLNGAAGEVAIFEVKITTAKFEFIHFLIDALDNDIECRIGTTSGGTETLSEITLHGGQHHSFHANITASPIYVQFRNSAAVVAQIDTFKTGDDTRNHEINSITLKRGLSRWFKGSGTELWGIYSRNCIGIVGDSSSQTISAGNTPSFGNDFDHLIHACLAGSPFDAGIDTIGPDVTLVPAASIIFQPGSHLLDGASVGVGTANRPVELENIYRHLPGGALDYGAHAFETGQDTDLSIATSAGLTTASAFSGNAAVSAGTATVIGQTPVVAAAAGTSTVVGLQPSMAVSAGIATVAAISPPPVIAASTGIATVTGRAVTQPSLAASTGTGAVIGMSPFTEAAVFFDPLANPLVAEGDGDWLRWTAQLDGAVDAKTALIFVSFTSTIAMPVADEFLISQVSGNYSLRRTTNDKMKIVWRNGTGNVRANITSTDQYGAEKVSVLIALDNRTGGTSRMYVHTDTSWSAEGTDTTGDNDDFDFTRPSFTIGIQDGDPTLNGPFDGNTHAVYVAPGAFDDITQASVRDKFLVESTGVVLNPATIVADYGPGLIRKYGNAATYNDLSNEGTGGDADEKGATFTDA